MRKHSQSTSLHAYCKSIKLPPDLTRLCETVIVCICARLAILCHLEYSVLRKRFFDRDRACDSVFYQIEIIARVTVAATRGPLIDRSFLHARVLSKNSVGYSPDPEFDRVRRELVVTAAIRVIPRVHTVTNDSRILSEDLI